MKLLMRITKIFHENCKSLNCLKPTVEPKATEHIKEMIEMTVIINFKKVLLTKIKDMYIFC